MSEPSATETLCDTLPQARPAAPVGVTARVVDLLLRRLGARIRRGSLTVELPDGRRHHFRGEGEESAVWQLHSARALSRVIAGGAMGLAESYLDGEWTSPDLTRLLLLLGANEDRAGNSIEGIPVLRWLNRAWHSLHANTRRQSRRNIAYHYDLGNAFYGAWLDPTMTYSAALFAEPADPTEPLERAQARKYAHLGALIGLAPGQDVLEIGCGWGGFAEYAAGLGAQVHGISLSREQVAWAQSRLARAGLAERTRIELRDYRDLDRRYDRIASIEMFEAVGERYWPQYAATLARSLTPDGIAGLQIITIDAQRFESYRRRPDFIQRHVFPGGMLPTEDVLARVFGAAGLAITRTVRFGLDYARTLAVWRERFEEAWPSLVPMGFDERFRRLWRYYLCYCEAGFRLGAIDVVQLRVEPIVRV